MTGFLPKDMKDLEDMFYNQARLEDRMKYESWIQDQLSPEQEKEIKNLFSKLGNCEKIPEDDSKKTFDFKITESQILIEVTTINLQLGETTVIDDKRIISGKVRNAIKHIKDKDASEFNGYFRGGVIYCSSILLSLTSLWDILLNPDMRKKIISPDLDYIIFLPKTASINQSDSRTLYPPLVFVKTTLISKFKDNFPNNYMIIKI